MGRGHGEADDITHLVEGGIGRQLGGVGLVRLQAEDAPDPRNHALAHPDPLGHMARVDQWVVFSGWLSTVSVIIPSIAVSSTAHEALRPGTLVLAQIECGQFGTTGHPSGLILTLGARALRLG